MAPTIEQEDKATVGAIRSLERRHLTESEQRRRKIIAVVGLVFFLVTLGWVTDNPISRAANKYLMDPTWGRNKAANCKEEANRNTVYCQDYGGAKDKNWGSIQRKGGGKSQPFSLGGR